MQMIVAVIHPYKLNEVHDALIASRVHGMTVSEVRGFGRQKGEEELPSGREVTMNFLPKVKIEVAVTDKQADKVVKAICRAARTGQIGDGKVFVHSLREVVRIRNGETAEAAL